VKKIPLLILGLFFSGSAFAQIMVYSPQRASGWEGMPGLSGSHELRTYVSIRNPSDFPATITVFFADATAQRVVQKMTYDGGLIKYAYGDNIYILAHASEAFTLSTDSGGQLSTGILAFYVPASIKPGEGQLSSSVQIQVTLDRLDYIGNVTSSANIPVGQNSFTLEFPVLLDRNSDTGVALFNQNSEPVQLNVNLYDSTNRLRETENIELVPGQQLARYVSQLFRSARFVSNFQGHIEIIASKAIPMMTLKYSMADGSFQIVR
jgi:hypothetical protein